MSAEPANDADVRDMGTAELAGRNALDITTLRGLSHRNDRHGALRWAFHLAVMSATAWLVAWSMPHWYLLVPALVLHGFTIVTMFAPMHESVHRTAFATPVLNEIVGWIAGLLGFYNFHYYRRFHTWHHRYTQDPERDPELSFPKPRNAWQYAVEISGYHFWSRRPSLFAKLSLGRMDAYSFIPVAGRRKVQVSTAVQSGIYLAAAASCAFEPRYAWWYWFLPAILAQPLLRLMLIVEHTGCSYDENGLTNTRTTLAALPVRLLMWNMPFHAEHHLYPSIPFHRLPAAHGELQRKLLHVEPSYAASNRAVVRSLGQAVECRRPATS